MADLYMQSTTPGKCWAVSVMKTNRGVIMGTAQEGEYTPPEKEGGFSSFSFMLFQDRHVNAPTAAKRLTDKARKEARDAIIAKLLADGLAVAGG